MTKLQFALLCSQYGIAPAIALEDEQVQKILLDMKENSVLQLAEKIQALENVLQSNF